MVDFQEQVDSLLQSRADRFSELRASAIAKARKLGIPTRKTESFKYLNLKPFWEMPLLDSPSEIAAQEITSNGSQLVFVNGQYREEMSSMGGLTEVYSFQTAVDRYGLTLENRIRKSIAGESSYFALLNAALHDKGLFVYIPPKTKLDQPIEIVHVLTDGDQSLIPRIHMFVGAGAEVTVLQKTVGQSNEAASMNLLVDFSLEEGARVHAADVLEMGENDWLFSHVRATLKRDSFFGHSTATPGAAGLRSDVRCSLLEEGSEVDLKGMWSLSDKRNAHTVIRVEHLAPHTKSSQHYRGVLRNSSRSSFEGQVYVEREAQLTDAYQLSEQIILDDEASAFTKPNLEIFADDVKASHGATISQISEEEVFYLQTRGLDPATSKNMIVNGFLAFILKDIPCDILKERIRSFL